MAKITNLDDLKRMHDWARIAKVGSKEWIDFALAMIDSFPAIYDMAKVMNKRMVGILDENERLRAAAVAYFEQADKAVAEGWIPYDEFKAAILAPNVQIEGLADRETWPEPRKFKKLQAAKRTLIGQSRSNAGFGIFNESLRLTILEFRSSPSG